MAFDCHEALNLGNERLVTIDQLLEINADFTGKKLSVRHALTKPQGVR